MDIYIFGASQKNAEQVYCHVSVVLEIFKARVFEANNTVSLISI